MLACIMGPEMRMVATVQRPALPPKRTPITTSATSSAMRTERTEKPFLSTKAKVSASYAPRP